MKPAYGRHEFQCAGFDQTVHVMAIRFTTSSWAETEAITAKSNHGILLHALGRQAEAEAFYCEALEEAVAW